MAPAGKMCSEVSQGREAETREHVESNYSRHGSDSSALHPLLSQRECVRLRLSMTTRLTCSEQRTLSSFCES